MPPFTSRILKTTNNYTLYKILAEEETKRPAYYFLLVDHLKSLLLDKKLQAKQPFDLSDYGKIIASGFGEEPSKEVEKRVMMEYGN